MAKARKVQVYQTTVTVVGLSLWAVSLMRIVWGYSLHDQITVLILSAVTVVVGLFSHHFQFPMGKQFTRETFAVTLSDAVVLLVACWGGVFPAVLVAGIEGFTSVARTRRQLSSFLFSSAIMSVGAGISAMALLAVLRYGVADSEVARQHPFLAVTLA